MNVIPRCSALPTLGPYFLFAKSLRQAQEGEHPREKLHYTASVLRVELVRSQRSHMYG